MNILITGTSSGIGKSLCEKYKAIGNLVIHVNRGASFELYNDHSSNEFFIKCDITSFDHVDMIFKELSKKNIKLDFVYLNAGVNVPDFCPDFNLINFKKNMDINLYGSINFVGAAKANSVKGATFIFFSSTSNIVPNPFHFGYFLSKYSIFEAQKFFQKNERKNIYKVVILGPIKTNISRMFSPPKGFQLFILNFLIVNTSDCAEAIIKFSLSRKTVLRYPFKSIAIYYAAKILLFFLPNAYKVSERSE